MNIAGEYNFRSPNTNVFVYMIQTQEINMNENKRNNEEKTDEEHNQPDKTKKVIL